MDEVTDGTEPEADLSCPICESLLEADRQWGTTLHVCADHGVWLDRGSLHGMLNRFSVQSVGRKTGGGARGRALRRLSRKVREVSEDAEQSAARNEEERPAEERDCPVCSGQLIQSSVSDVLIESCADHGSWFDRHELALLRVRFARKGLREVRQIERELKRIEEANQSRSYATAAALTLVMVATR